MRVLQVALALVCFALLLGAIGDLVFWSLLSPRSVSLLRRVEVVLAALLLLVALSPAAVLQILEARFKRLPFWGVLAAGAWSALLLGVFAGLPVLLLLFAQSVPTEGARLLFSAAAMLPTVGPWLLRLALVVQLAGSIVHLVRRACGR